MSNNPFDTLVTNVLNALPKAAKELRADTEKNLRAALEAGLQKMELVSRTEFEAQKSVLENTLLKLEALQAKLTALEKSLDTN